MYPGACFVRQNENKGEIERDIQAAVELAG